MEKDSRDIIKEMKESYQNIPVPEDAKKRIQEGIEHAKKEKRTMMIMNIMKHTGITTAAALLAITVMANATPTTAHAMENIPVLGAIAKVVTFRTFEDNQGNYEAKVEVPQISLGNDVDDSKVNQSIEEYANRLIAQYEEEISKDQIEDGHYAVDSTYDVVTDNDKYLSLRISTTVIMASGAETVKIFTIDKASGAVVSLNTLLGESQEKLTAISDNIKQQMVDQMDADNGKIYFYNSGDAAMASDEFKEVTGNESYYFNQNGELVIAFDEYQVAPGYMGAVEFSIPKAVTGELY